MNIGIDIRNIGKNRTGDETVFFQLAYWLPRVDPFNTYRLLIDDRSEEEQKEIEKRLGIKDLGNVTLELCGSGNKFLWNIWNAPMSAKRLDLDVYHTQYILPLWMPQKTKMVTHIHDISFARNPEYISWKDRAFLGYGIPRSLRMAKKIVAVSQFTKDEIIDYYGIAEEKIVVAYNAVDPFISSQVYSQEEQFKIREKYKLQEKYILHVGTLQPRKNIPFLLESFAELQKRIPDVALCLTGNKNSYHFDTKIEQVIQEKHIAKSIQFLGYVEKEDLPYIIDGAQVLVSTSLYEGFGVPLLEAMSRNVPVIASDIDAHKEVVEKNALLVAPGDIATLTNSLYSVLTNQDLRNDLRGRGLSRSQFFDWEKTAKIIADFYRNF